MVPGGVGARALLLSGFERYQSLLKRRPFVVNAATGFVIAFTGDVLCQLLVEERPYSLRRSVELGLVRAFAMAPFLSVYFPFLNRMIPLPASGSTRPRVILRVLADQAFGAPVGLSLFFVGSGVVQGSLAQVPERLREQLLPCLGNSVMFWPFVHYFNFSYVPVVHQAGVAHLAGLLFSIILSYRANAPLKGGGGGGGESGSNIATLGESANANVGPAAGLAATGTIAARGGALTSQERQEGLR